MPLPRDGGMSMRFPSYAVFCMLGWLLLSSPVAMAAERELAHDDGNQHGKRSLGGSAHVVEFKKPRGRWWIESVRVFGQPYGGGYDPATTPLIVTITNPRMKALHTTRSSYAVFRRRGFAWAEIPLAEPVACPSTFRVVLDFDPGRTQGVFVGIAAGEEGHAFTGRAGGRAEPLASGTWMIRARLVNKKPRAEPRVEPDADGGGDAKRYLRDLGAIDKLVRRHFPSLEKKGVDWPAVVEEARASFAGAPDDAAHVLNATRLVARLGDMHSGVVGTKVDAHVPSFDGLYGAGLWIATDAGRLLLRATTPDHPVGRRLPPGTILLSIDGRPARIVHREVRQRLRVWHGWSSTHFLDARLSFQFFPFGKRSQLEARFLRFHPDRVREEVVTIALGRWGPDGRGLSRQAVTMPPGLEAKGSAVATMLDEDLGYLRILGGQNEETRQAFDAALERVRDAKGLVLDARGMGGGGDAAAWAMAGRFFAKPRSLPHDPTLRATGDWTFEGPVVWLQDERMVSSAETFTWAMVETERAVAVGRPTGGATIIPRTFDVPSGLFRLRLGVRDRETSVGGVHPEGIGTPPDVHVPYAEAVFLGRERDPILAAGRDVLRLLVAGAPRDVVVGAYEGVLGADASSLAAAIDAFRTLDRSADLAYPDLLDGLVERRVDEEIRVADAALNLAPDVVGARTRLTRLGAVARVLGLDEAAGRAERAAEHWPQEVAAQEAFEQLAAPGLPPSSDARDAYLEAHDGTRWAEAVRQAYPAGEGRD